MHIPWEAWFTTEVIGHSTPWHVLSIPEQCASARKNKGVQRIHQSMKGGVAPIQEWSHQHHSSNIVLVWSHSLNWEGILSQTKEVGINLHGTSSSGFPKSRTSSRASSLDCCRLCIDYGACCLGSSECLLSTWIRDRLLKLSTGAFRGTSLKCLDILN